MTNFNFLKTNLNLDQMVAIITGKLPICNFCEYADVYTCSGAGGIFCEEGIRKYLKKEAD